MVAKRVLSQRTTIEQRYVVWEVRSDHTAHALEELFRPQAASRLGIEPHECKIVVVDVTPNLRETPLHTFVITAHEKRQHPPT